MSVRPIDALSTMAKSSGVAKKDLLVLAPANDPFNSGTPTNVVMAQWFARVLNEHHLPRGKHLRRHHYLLSTLDQPVILPNGKPYENTEACWNYLQTACSHARYQGLVDPDQFRDQRNPDAKENQAVPRGEPEPSWEIGDCYVLDLPDIPKPQQGLILLPDIDVVGYDYDDGDQPYHIEVWIEKSTMDVELDPICKKYRVTKKQGIGFDSVTSVIKMLKRCRPFIEMGRPIRIFYISDFDPAGFFMPQAIARQIQFWLWRWGLKADIRLKPLVLTKTQVEEFDLPRKPIKDEDPRKRNFEARLGEGHVELDALAALHPGEFERIVTEAIKDYRDPYLHDDLEYAYRDAIADAEAAWEDATERLRSEADDLQHRMNAIADRHFPKVNKLRDELEAELAPLKAEMKALEERSHQELTEAKQRLAVDLPPRPDPDPPAEAELDNWLYDSTRTFGEQVDHFRSYKNGELE